jgi:hypothetical protein
METMMKTYALSALLAALLAGSALTTAALADRGDRGGPGAVKMPPFEEVDTNSDGQLTREEIDAWRTTRATAIDSNGDGNVSLEELTAAEAAQAAERAQRMMEARDANGDGMLTAAEMMLPAVPDRMFDRIDTDGDGAISKAEAEAASERMADRMGRHGHRPMSDRPHAP